MAFEKLKKNQQQMPRPTSGPMAAPPAPRPNPSLADKAGQMAMNKGMDMVMNKGANALFGKLAGGAAAKGATAAATGAAASGAGAAGSGLMAAAMTNPVTAPLAAGAALLGGKKLLGK